MRAEMQANFSLVFLTPTVEEWPEEEVVRDDCR